MDKQIAIQTALFQQMLAASNITIITSTLLAAILAYMQREVIVPTVILAWFSLMVLVAISRAILAYSNRRSPAEGPSSLHARLARFRIGVLSIGVVTRRRQPGATGYPSMRSKALTTWVGLRSR